MTQTATQQPASTWNEVTFTGNLGRDPELTFTNNGNAVTKFSIAVSQGKERPSMWLNIECWRELAKHCDAKLTKGARVEVSGRLAQDSWNNAEGQKRTSFKVVAQSVRLLKRRTENRASGFSEETGEDGDDDPLGELNDHPF